MSPSQKGGHAGRHRAEDLPVRRWLQLGAASAGMGAALIGWSLVGSEIGVAGADSGVASSSAASPSKGVDSGSAAPSPSGRAGKAASRTDAPSQGVRPNAVGPPIVIAGRGDPFGTAGRFAIRLAKELLNRKTTLNPIQRLDDLTPKAKSLFDLIPRTPVPRPSSAEVEKARNAEIQRQNDVRARQINVIVQKGVRLTARDGTAIYTIDGKTFVKYMEVSGSSTPQPTLVNLSNKLTERNRDLYIRVYLKLDPVTVRRLWGK